MRASANIENVRLLDPWDEEMGSFADGFVKNAPETVEEDSALATVDGVEARVNGGGGGTETEGGACEVREEGDGCLVTTHWREIALIAIFEKRSSRNVWNRK